MTDARIPFSQYLLNAISAFFVTAILAIPVAWLISVSCLFALKGLRYGTVQLAPVNFKMVFVSEQETSKILGGDFSLHSSLFKREGRVYSAEINGNTIQFITNDDGWPNTPCDATVNTRSIGCEEIIYSHDFYNAKFVRLTGDIGVTVDQAKQLNSPHFQFDEWLETVRTCLFVLLPIGLFFCVRAVGRRWRQKHIPQLILTRQQKIGLQLPWAIGLIVWGALRAMF